MPFLTLNCLLRSSHAIETLIRLDLVEIFEPQLVIHLSGIGEGPWDFSKVRPLSLPAAAAPLSKDGSCGSIGYGIATAYAKEGANLVITGRNVQKLEDAKEELERLYGIKVLPIQADVSAGNDNAATVQNVIDKTIEEFGRIDVLINNAQASASGVSLAEHTTDQFDLAIYSGLYAAFYYMQACYPHLKETKGTVINFASGAGALRQCWTVFLRCCKRRHSWPHARRSQ